MKAGPLAGCLHPAMMVFIRCRPSLTQRLSITQQSKSAPLGRDVPFMPSSLRRPPDEGGAARKGMSGNPRLSP